MRNICSAMMCWGKPVGHVPRHAKRYADFASEYARLQQMRIAAMTAFASDVHDGGLSRAAVSGGQ